MAEDYGKGGELILPPGVYAFVLDQTKGHIGAYTGPYKSSLSTSDQLVNYNKETKRFDPARNIADAIQTNIIVPKGSYVVLENPASKQPEPGRSDTLTVGMLRMGQIENLPGPKSFSLWPGQVATVIPGHHLKTNQYLLGRIIDDEAARENWDKSVVKGVADGEHKATATDGEHKTEGDDKKTDEKTPVINVLGIDKEKLVTGQLIVIRGNAVAFYIPPTGVEIVKDELGKYVRDAVTLEVLEFSILLDQSGTKVYKRGPDVVFPTPTQEFFTKKDQQTGEIARKFRAFELQPSTGVHIKVISPYTDEISGETHKAGDELFITGETTPIYYPREEHAVINYGGSDKAYAIEIPGGEGRYVLNRKNGDITLVRGPNMFLPNPIEQVVVRRVLPPAECELYYPGNEEVKRINDELRGKIDADIGGGYASSSLEAYQSETTMRLRSSPSSASVGALMRSAEPTSKGAFADKMSRGSSYTPPRTVILNTRFEGAIKIDVWTGFAVQVVNSKGDRHTVVGPQSILLEYDEYLEPQKLSRGKPKNPDSTLRTPFLRYMYNSVSDIINVKTKDLVGVDLPVKYLVRFEEKDKDVWFNIENYVQYLVDHIRSLIGNTIRNIGIENFYFNAADIIRNTILGEKPEGGERPLRYFLENGMTIYEVEVGPIKITDNEVANLLATSRREALNNSVKLDQAREKLLLTQGQEDAERRVLAELAETAQLKDKLVAEATNRQASLKLAAIEADNSALIRKEEGKKSAEEIAKITKALYLDSTKAEKDLQQGYEEQQLIRTIKLLAEEAAAAKLTNESVQPGLIEALVAAANAGILERVAPALAPLAIVQGESVSGILENLLKGTPVEKVIQNLKTMSKVNVDQAAADVKSNE